MTDKSTPTRLFARLKAVHRREQTLSFLRGLLAFSTWLILLFLACLAMDWLVRLPAVVRYAALPLLVGFPAFKAWKVGWTFLSAFKPAETALKIETHYDKLESLLVTGVQLRAGRPTAGTSEAMSDLTVMKADAAAAGLEPSSVVPFESLTRPAVKTGLLCAVIGVVAVLNVQLLAVGFTRLFTPWQWAQYPTRTVIELTGGELVVKEGEPVAIGARIAGDVPARAKLALRTGKGKPRTRTLPVVDGVCEYQVGSAFRSFDYFISAGDARSTWQTVKVIASPRVARTEIRLTFPDYMQRAPETMEAMTLTVPEGATIHWALRLDRPVSKAVFRLEGGEPMPLDVSADGLTVKHAITADASGAYAFSWVEKQYGFDFDTPKHYLQVSPDQAPQVELLSPSRNLFATIGRKLVLGYRARDDHGLGESKIAYRRGNADERTVSFTAEASSGREVRDIDWDYRKALKDLDVGETVSFAIEVTDLYPPPAGPHRTRTESRRVSFLSQEDYLAKVDEQKERLLSQLRAVYRQERAAHEVISQLDPRSDSFEQTCFLESARQDILVERIAALGGGITELIDDLRANNIDDNAEFDGLSTLRARLDDIARTQLATAASQLRDLGPNVNGTVDDVARVASEINAAARALSSLVLNLGVREAMEVFAMELHVIAQSQSTLRVQTIDAAPESSQLAARQRALGAWTGELLAELSANPDYSKAPLLIVRLARMIKDMRGAGIEAAMAKAADLLDEGNRQNSADVQQEIVSKLFELECHIRVGSEYEALLAARKCFASGIEALEQACGVDSGFPETAVGHALRVLQRDLRLLILPAIPTPTDALLAETPSAAPPVDALVAALQGSLGSAASAIDAGKVEEGRAEAQKALEALQRLDGIIAVRLSEITKVSRYAGHAGASADRSVMIRELFASQMRLTEKTEDAEYDETHAAYLAPSQLHLSKEVLQMCARLERKNTGASASSAVEPMLRMLEEASDAMTQASPALEKEALDDAIAHQDRALDALQAAMSFANHEADGWAGLANLAMTAEGIALPATFMRDIAAEQRDLIAATQTSTPESRAELVLIQTNLVLAVLDVSMLVQGTGSGLDFEQAMLFAGSDMGLSAQMLKDGDIAGAMRAQEQATESVLDLSGQFDDYERQFFYFVTAMEFLQDMHTDGVVLSDDIGSLCNALEAADDRDAKRQTDEMGRLLKAADAFCSRMLQATGRPDYTKCRASLSSAEAKLVAGEPDAALDHALAAKDFLQASLTELRELMSHVAAVPAISPIEAPPEYDVMLDMVSLLLDQKALARAVYTANKDALPGMVDPLGELEAEARDLVDSTGEHPYMVAARQLMADAAGLLGGAAGPEAFDKLHESETKLRQCILEYALYYVELPRSGGGRRRKKGKMGPSPTMFKMTLLNKRPFEKEWGGVDGEDPQAGRAEWEVLGRRDRAALNENFVRELPLEYREFLKDYFERLAE